MTSPPTSLTRPAPPPAPRPSRVTYALDLATTAATRGVCTRRSVGAAVLNLEGRVLALGYNGTPAGAPHCGVEGGCPRGAFTHDQIPAGLGNTGHDVACTADHAEDNATGWALAHLPLLDPSTCLVAITCAPCPDCAARLHRQRWGTVVWDPHPAAAALSTPREVVAGWGIAMEDPDSVWWT